MPEQYGNLHPQKVCYFYHNVMTSHFVSSNQYHLSGTTGQEPGGLMTI